MRALMVAEQLRRRVPGGIGTYIRGIVGGLASLGEGAPDVTLWASRAPRAGLGDRTPADPLAALAPVVCSPLPSPALVLGWDRGLIAAPDGFDVVHAPSLASPPSPRTPLAVTVHDLAWQRFGDTFPTRGRRWHEAALRRAVDRASLLVVPATATADDLLASGVDHRRVEVVEEGADHLPPPDEAGTDQKLSSLGVGGPFLLTVSTLEPRKNLQRLAAAFRRARPDLPDELPLVVVGPHGWGPTLDPEPGIVLAGATSGAVLAGLYRRAHAVVSVPLWEGFGLPVAEAMYAGAVVVSSPQPSLGAHFPTVDPADERAIARALVTACTDDAWRADVARAGQARAGELTWKAAATRHLDLWEQLAHAPSPRVAP